VAGKADSAAVGIRKFLPESYQGSVIITPRSSQVRIGHGLLLAIATAGAYLDQTAGSFSGYLCLYKESWVRLKEMSPELSSYEDRTLYSTWQMSFDYVKQRNPLSANLLRLWDVYGEGTVLNC
jgi:hypothetical protein